MPHRATFLTNGGVFDHRDRFSGQNYGYSQKRRAQTTNRRCSRPSGARQTVQKGRFRGRRRHTEPLSLRIAAFLTTNEPALVKTATICKNNSQSAKGNLDAAPPARASKLVGSAQPARRPSPTSSSAQLERLVSLGQPTPGAHAAHAGARWRSGRTHNQTHRQANEAQQSTQRALPRAPQAKSRAP